VIPYGKQDVTQADIDCVVEVLKSDFLTQGPLVPQFEEAVKAHVGAKHAVAVNSATSALHIACMALDLGPGDWLWTSPNTFVASANCALYCGAQVDFVDIDPRTYTLCPKALEAKLQQAEKEGRLPKIVIPVHFAGQPCDMSTIHAMSEKYGFKIIEDASHAIGATYNDIKVGCCAHSDITVFSFHPVKIITTGEGGMATTNNSELAERLIRLRTHGITSKSELMQARPVNEIWNYQQIELGFNYRMTDIQAALGVSQMGRLDAFVERRSEIAAEYDRALAILPVVIPWRQLGVCSSYHLYSIRIRESSCGKTQRQVYDSMRKKGVAVNLHYIPVHRQPYYEAMGFKKGDFPIAEEYYANALSLPIYSNLSKSDQSYVIQTLKGIFK